MAKFLYLLKYACRVPSNPIHVRDLIHHNWSMPVGLISHHQSLQIWRIPRITMARRDWWSDGLIEIGNVTMGIMGGVVMPVGAVQVHIQWGRTRPQRFGWTTKREGPLEIERLTDISGER
jgi:hypothetical protein